MPAPWPAAGRRLRLPWRPWYRRRLSRPCPSRLQDGESSARAARVARPRPDDQPSLEAERVKCRLERLLETSTCVAGARYTLNVGALRLQGLLNQDRYRLLIDELGALAPSVVERGNPDLGYLVTGNRDRDRQDAEIVVDGGADDGPGGARFRLRGRTGPRRRTRSGGPLGPLRAAGTGRSGRLHGPGSSGQGTEAELGWGGVKGQHARQTREGRRYHDRGSSHSADPFERTHVLSELIDLQTRMQTLPGGSVPRPRRAARPRR